MAYHFWRSRAVRRYVLPSQIAFAGGRRRIGSQTRNVDLSATSTSTSIVLSVRGWRGGEDQGASRPTASGKGDELKLAMGKAALEVCVLRYAARGNEPGAVIFLGS